MAWPITCPQDARKNTAAIAVSLTAWISGIDVLRVAVAGIQSAINPSRMARAMAWRRPMTPSLRALLFR